MRFVAGNSDRLDKAMVEGLPGLTRSAAQKLIETDRVQINGLPAGGSSQRLVAGDAVVVRPQQPLAAPPLPEAVALNILYEDDSIIVINKPAGMVVHPGAGNATGTLLNAVLAHSPQVAEAGDEDRPGVVHRLDKETSGVMLIAKTDAALQNLQAQFKARSIHKTYIAVCVGIVLPARAIISKPIGRNPQNRQKMAILATGRDAVTEYLVMSTTLRHTLLQAHPRTGRTHQLRVHFASIGFPIVGDSLYGGPAGARDALSRHMLPRHLLHAASIQFAHPVTATICVFQAPLPAEFVEALITADLDPNVSVGSVAAA